ncbi:MAG: carbohydrate ABC transporter permease [Chloroflexi bacterium]|nr:MAG: carbohydrate ABC transporter permease [Chloroflexota bacterium]
MIHTVTPHHRWQIIKSGFRYAILLIAFAFFAFPIFWIATTSLKLPEEYTTSPPIYIPQAPHLNHYTRGLGSQEGLRALRDSVIVSVGTTALTLSLGASAAYSMARFRTGGHHFSFWVLSQRMMPPIAIVLPVFLLYRQVQLIDTYVGLILLYTVFNLPLGIWMLRSYIIEVPVEVEESALVDGATRFQVLRHITVPLAAAGLSATMVFIFIFSWTEFLFALILTRTGVLTLPVLISRFFGTQSFEWGVAAALSVVATVPVVILGLLIRRHFVRGLTMGAVKQ